MEHLNLTPYRCPEPLIMVKLWLRQAKNGQSLAISLSDPGSRRDIPAYLTRLGHRILVSEQTPSCLHLQFTVGEPSCC